MAAERKKMQQHPHLQRWGSDSVSEHDATVVKWSGLKWDPVETLRTHRHKAGRHRSSPEKNQKERKKLLESVADAPTARATLFAGICCCEEDEIDRRNAASSSVIFASRESLAPVIDLCPLTLPLLLLLLSWLLLVPPPEVLEVVESSPRLCSTLAKDSVTTTWAIPKAEEERETRIHRQPTQRSTAMLSIEDKTQLRIKKFCGSQLFLTFFIWIFRK